MIVLYSNDAIVWESSGVGSNATPTNTKSFAAVEKLSITEIAGGVLFYKETLEKIKVSIQHKQQDVQASEWKV